MCRHSILYLTLLASIEEVYIIYSDTLIVHLVFVFAHYIVIRSALLKLKLI